MIENTIRQIKESQAEKEKTKDVRQQLEEFKCAIVEETKQVETKTEEKMAVLISKAKKIKAEKEPVPEKPLKPVADQPLKPGDAVRMVDTQAAGEVIAIEGNKVQVETGSLRFLVGVDKIERITKSDLRKSLRANQPIKVNDPVIVQRNINFKPEIDLRGVRGEEALNQVRDLIDNALIVQHRHLRILHGKGNGILRQLIRQYLDTVDVVKSFRDEHVEFGGSGITVVEMDV
jgi:DNA mismatch repair protein MutS2